MRSVCHSFSIFFLFVLLLAFPAKKGESAHPKNGQNVPTEFELKATYLYNFLKFIKWPKEACNLHDGRVHLIAVLGESPFNEVLRSMQERLEKRDSEVELRFYGPYREDMEFECCCLMFITSSELKNLPDIMEKIAERPILTVSDDSSLTDQGVMITLVMHNNKIRWVINRKPVGKTSLKLSAKLYDIAVKIIDQ